VQPVPCEGATHREIPGEVRIVYDPAVQAQLDATVGNLAQVEELRSCRTQRRNDLPLDERVPGFLVEERGLEGDPATKQACVKAGLDFLRQLGLEVCVAEVRQADTARRFCVSPDGRLGIEALGIDTAWLLGRLAVRGAQPEGVDRSGAFIAGNPGRTQLRKGPCVEVLSE
jgi:hypothetical protein